MHSPMDSYVWIDWDRADEDSLLFGRQGHVAVLVEGLDEATDKFIRRADGQRQPAGWNLIGKETWSTNWKGNPVQMNSLQKPV